MTSWLCRKDTRVAPRYIFASLGEPGNEAKCTCQPAAQLILVEMQISMRGTSEETERLRKYNEELHNFCKRRIFELPVKSDSGIGNVASVQASSYLATPH